MTLENQIIRMKTKNINNIEWKKTERILREHTYRNFIKYNKYIYFNNGNYNQSEFKEWCRYLSLNAKITKNMRSNIGEFEMFLKSFLISKYNKDNIQFMIKNKQKFIMATVSRQSKLDVIEYEKDKEKYLMKNYADIIHGITMNATIDIIKGISNEEELDNYLCEISSQYRKIKKVFTQGEFSKKSKKKQMQVFKTIKHIDRLRGVIYHGMLWTALLNDAYDQELRKSIYYVLNNCNKNDKKYIDFITIKGVKYSKYKNKKYK